MTLFDEVPADTEMDLPPAARLEPVSIEQVRECHFKAKGCGTCGLPKANKVHKAGGGCTFRRKQGCARCGQAKSSTVHLGAPPSINALGSGDPAIYQALKQQWQTLFGELLAASGLRKGLAHVAVDGEATFPDRGRRDQGNYRVLVEKALGDALVEGGWLEDDDWTRYEFGSLGYNYEAGRSAIRLFIFPRVDAA